MKIRSCSEERGLVNVAVERQSVSANRLRDQGILQEICLETWIRGKGSW